jgi:hypothetical protein
LPVHLSFPAAKICGNTSELDISLASFMTLVLNRSARPGIHSKLEIADLARHILAFPQFGLDLNRRHAVESSQLPVRA